jgi:hypothetical protein
LLPTLPGLCYTIWRVEYEEIPAQEAMTVITTRCLQCGEELAIDVLREGEGYFFGYDTDFYGAGIDDQRDPHEIVGYFCRRCGSQLRDVAGLYGKKTA